MGSNMNQLLEQEESIMASVSKIFAVAVQLGLLVLVIHRFGLESKALFQISVLTFIGFLIHSLLPYRYRLSFFLLLSLAGIILVIGPSSGAWLIGIGLVLIGICHLPIPFMARVLLLLACGASLAAFRLDWVHAPWPSAIWPILGSIFMFRLMIYLYDLRHEKSPPTVWRTLSYFFLLPNVCFPLFPVVDYKTFRRTYYDDDPYHIYQAGVRWMLRGITHLLLYRLIYHNFSISPSEVVSPGDLARFLLTNYLLYLRVSGQFHLIVGMLLLFGFNLPETHHRYYLASSFNDFWRRINIYWKDFMTKIFYYPSFLKLRKWGATSAFVISTLFVFFITWLLHSYQWFWLRGTFPISSQDILFWGILAMLVVGNSLYESKHGRERSLRTQSRSFRNLATLSLRTAGTFIFICILWSLWTSASVSEWLSLWSFAGKITLKDVSLISLLFVAAVAIGGNAHTKVREEKTQVKTRKGPRFQRSALVTGASILLIYLMGSPRVYSRLGSKASELIHSLRGERLNRQDDALLERGYYENLLGVDRFNTQLWELYMKQPKGWVSLQQTDAMRLTADFLYEELVPLSQVPFRGTTLHTNRWGMRDRDYDKIKPPGTFRVALLGSSHVMGSGVADEETFESILENRLNSETNQGRHAKFEILNFAVAGYSPLQQVMVLEKTVASFHPDSVFYVAHASEVKQATDHLSNVVRNGIRIPYDYLGEIVHKAGIDEKTPGLIAEKKLAPFGPEMLSWTYHRIVQDCREQGVFPVWIFLPRIDKGDGKSDLANLVWLAEESGFTVLNLSGVYENHKASSLQVADWDHHPNAKGHRLIADRLYKALSEREQAIPFDLPARAQIFAHDRGDKTALKLEGK
jgi:D-alanyl-lipoteichoic acid acyltransferase DltB (MBOAT superfamily)